MPFKTNAEIKTGLSAAIHKTSATISATVWDDIISSANTAAYWLICEKLLKLGYSQAQIDAWDGGPIYQEFLARYQALIDGGGDKDSVGEWRRELDYWRKKLEDLTEISDGGVVDDAADISKLVGYGDLRTDDDLFVLDPEDPRRGQNTEW